MKVLYDAGALIAADRDDDRMWRRHRALLNRGYLPLTTAPVVSQVSRSPRQALLHRLLIGCQVVAFADTDMHAVGTLLAASGTSDVVDGHLALTAIQRRATVITSDPDDITHLVSQAAYPPPVVPL